MADQLLLDMPAVLDDNGNPVAGGTVTAYDVATAIKSTLYSDAAMTTPASNPVLLDAAGRAPAIYVDGADAIRLVIRDSNGSFVREIAEGFMTQVGPESAATLPFDPITGNTATNVQTAIANVQAGLSATVPVARGGTGATTAAAARTNLGLGPFGKAVVTISATSDLDSLSDGVYAWASTSEPTNAPFGGGTLLQNTRGSQITQFAWSEAGAIAIRDKISGTWNDWSSGGVAKNEFGPYTISAGGAVSIEHGMGAAPYGIQYVLQCLTAENGYEVGNRIYVGNASASYDLSALVTKRVINIRFGNGTYAFASVNADTGAAVNLTNANWELWVRVMA